jgi:hypothetical protein
VYPAAVKTENLEQKQTQGQYGLEQLAQIINESLAPTVTASYEHDI